MIFTYKCNKCNKTEDIKIKTHDILVRKNGSMCVDEDIVEKRKNKERFCDCGGILHRQYSAPMVLFCQYNRNRFEPISPQENKSILG